MTSKRRPPSAAGILCLWGLAFAGCCSGWTESTNLNEDFESGCFLCDWSVKGPVARGGAFHPGEHVVRMGPGAALSRDFVAMGHARVNFMVRCDADAQLRVVHETDLHRCRAQPFGGAAVTSVGAGSTPQTTEQIVTGKGVEESPVGDQRWTRVERRLELVPGGATQSARVTLRFEVDGDGECDLDQVRYLTSRSDCDGCGAAF